eukprot:scaffold92609_cov26-Prasinocladus_malaysianus.AAC.1
MAPQVSVLLSGSSLWSPHRTAEVQMPLFLPCVCTRAILEHLRSLLFGRPAQECFARPGTASHGSVGGSSGAERKTSGIPNVLVIDGPDETEDGAEDVGELLASPGADHKPYDE